MDIRRGLLALTVPVLLIPLALLTASCASGRSSDNPFQGGGGSDPIRLHVTNLLFNDATLYARLSGSRERLGILTGKDEETYTIPWEPASDLRVEIDLIAGRRCTTRPIPINPGDQVQLVIDRRLLSSGICR
jgi:hypothetical protein